jgi:endonuclease/exonuclease/phosphatase family metal-dependent hydrolase
MKANSEFGLNSKPRGEPRGRNTIHRALVCLLTAVSLVSVSTAQAGAIGVGGPRSVDAMTVNLYFGGGTERVLALDPTDPGFITNLIATVTGVYYEVIASQPQVRLEAVADRIRERMPDFVSLEEVSLLRVQSPGDIVVGGTMPATTVVFDYLQILTNALAARGAAYTVAASVNEIDVELPMLNLQTGSIDDARWTDRDVILVRSDLPRGQLRVSHPQSGNFTNVIQIPTLGISVLRGWCSVDVFLRGQTFRYICTHLEEETVPQLQILQAQELLGGPAKTHLPVVITGDFNSDPLHRDGSLAYDVFTAANYRDAWAVLHPLDPAGGLTWGHDEFLADPNTLFDRRIDFVFYRGSSFVPTQAEPIDMTLDRTQPPLWASDHAALAVELGIKGGPASKAKSH